MFPKHLFCFTNAGDMFGSQHLSKHLSKHYPLQPKSVSKHIQTFKLSNPVVRCGSDMCEKLLRIKN